MEELIVRKTAAEEKSVLRKKPVADAAPKLPVCTNIAKDTYE